MDKDLILARAFCHQLLPVTLGAIEEEAPHDGDDVTRSDPEGEAAQIGLIFARTNLLAFLPSIKKPETRSKSFHPAGQSLKASAVQQERKSHTSVRA